MWLRRTTRRWLKYLSCRNFRRIIRDRLMNAFE
ncbi:unnamed protein product [Anisakis simplex]|uniref:Uncharacterized protein n=1 Tax=Anisakis simplex TaxID=6269 RepID=A0A0M3J6Z8_ANISI|nr:unnamed protein product [Anisakis simplex]